MVADDAAKNKPCGEKTQQGRVVGVVYEDTEMKLTPGNVHNAQNVNRVQRYEFTI